MIPQVVSNQVSEWIDEAEARHRAAEAPRDYLGASILGDPCRRKVAYHWHRRQDPEDFPGRVLRIFDMGHDSESRMETYLKRAGFDLRTQDSVNGEQFEFKAFDGRVAGHADGIIYGGPLSAPYPLVWENKALGASPWRSLVSKGLKEDRPTYHGQLQIYIYAFRAKGGLFTAVNRDTGEVYAEVVMPDTRYALNLLDFAGDVVESGSPEEFPRISNDPSFWVCKLCRFASVCHEGAVRHVEPEPDGEPLQGRAAIPSWLRKKLKEL